MRNNAVQMFTEIRFEDPDRRGAPDLEERRVLSARLVLRRRTLWVTNAKMEELLATTSLFGPAREKVDRFLFRGDGVVAAV